MGQIIGVVLAGGEGRRMGRPKGEIRIGDANLTERAAAVLRPICGSVIVSIGAGGANPAPSYDAIEDQAPAGRGPLAGIASSFAATGRADLLVLACDYPGVETTHLRALLAAAGPQDDLVMPVDPSGRDHPLVALWRRTAERAVVAALQEGHFRVAALLPDLRVRRVPAHVFPGLDAVRCLRNVNWPSDLAGLEDPVTSR